MFSKTEHIIFDLDGTLIDSSAGVAEATNYALSKLGQPPRSIEEISPFIGYPLEDMFASFCDCPIDELKMAFQMKARHSVTSSALPMPQVSDVLQLLSAAGYKLAVATTKYKLHTEGIVAKFGWRDYFKALASGDEVANVKPSPDVIKLALKKLDADAEGAVMVGDTIIDILAARAAGIKVISIKSPFGRDNLGEAGPDLLLNNITELPEVFGL
jgi:HAD superfamily hydrolase (TIGR01509 family)